MASDDGRGHSAHLRRHYMHVRAGGTLTEHDMSKHVAKAEELEQRVADLEAEILRLRRLRNQVDGAAYSRCDVADSQRLKAEAELSTERAKVAEAVAVLKSRDDIDGLPGIVEAAIVILECEPQQS